MTLRRHLLLVVLSSLVPLFAVALVLAGLLAQSDRARMEDRLQESARLLGHALDGELEKSIAALQVLAQSDSLRRDDLRSFYERASLARPELGIWENLLLLSPKADHLLNLKRPFGEPLPKVPQPEGTLTAAQTRKPFVSNVLRGRVETDWLMYMAVPVIIDGEVKYVLGATISSDYWSRWLKDRAPAQVTASISGRDMNVLARTADPQRTLGKPVTEWYQELIRSKEHGFARGSGILAPDLVAAWQRSKVSGWTVNVFTSAAAVDQPMRRTFWVLAIGLLVALALAVLLSASRGRLLTRGAGQVQAALQSLKGPKPAIPEPNTSVTEFDAALVSAGNTASVLDSRAQALLDADKRKDEFLATLAHELRGPMAPIRNAVELLRLSDSPDVTAKARDIIHRQAEHLRRLVDDLLDVSRITRGQIRMELEQVDLADVVQEALEATRPLVEAAGVEVRVSLPSEPLRFAADRTRLVQILSNLLSNAAKFTPKGGHVWVTAQRDGDEVSIQVRDDGVGIATEDLPHVFDMFARMGQRSAEGLGIGLALVRGLVEKHGGTISAQSAGQDSGATFTLRLPMRDAQAPESQADRAGSPPAAPGSKRILVADDMADAANSLAQLLKLKGCEVFVAGDGLEAFEVAARVKPDIAILDIGMPGMNGYDTAVRIRSEPWGRDMTLVALTGWGQEQDRNRAMAAGFDTHLTKPADMARLDAIVGTS